MAIPAGEVVFDLTGHRSRVSSLESLKEKQGWLVLDNIEVNSFELTDHLIFTGITSEGQALSQEQCQRMMELSARLKGVITTDAVSHKIDAVRKNIIEGLKIDLKNKDVRFLQHEVTKLNKWAEDRIFLVEKELKDTKLRIRELVRLAAQATEPSEQLEIQKKIQELEKKQRKQRQQIFDAEDQIVEQRDGMIKEIEKRMMRNLRKQHIFTIKWSIE